MQSALVTNFIVADRVQPATATGSDADAAPRRRPRRPTGAAGRGGRAGGAGGAGGAQSVLIRRFASGGAAVLLRAEPRPCTARCSSRPAATRPTIRCRKSCWPASTTTWSCAWRRPAFPVKLRVNVQARFLDQDRNSYNVLAELPGTDPALRDQVVMLGAHLDSWHTGTGATDNADGVAAVTGGLPDPQGRRPPDRSARCASRSGAPKRKVSTDRRRGCAPSIRPAGRRRADQPKRSRCTSTSIPAKAASMAGTWRTTTRRKPIFDAWMAPFKDLGALKNVRQGIGNTDHLSFIAPACRGSTRFRITSITTCASTTPTPIRPSAWTTSI